MREKITNPDAIRTWPGKVPVEYVYTVGVASEPFFRALMERGRLLASPCPECGVRYLPPRLFCERCFSRLEASLELEPRGTLEAFTVVHVDLDGNRLDEPQAYGLVRIHGADTALVHRLAASDADEPEVGMEVEAVLLPPAERTGSILDIRHFRPV